MITPCIYKNNKMTTISTIALMIVYSCFREGAWVIFTMLTTWNQIPSHHVNQYSKLPPMQCLYCDMYLAYNYDWWWFIHTYTNPSTYVTTDSYQILLWLFKLTSLVVIIIRFSVIDVWIFINKFWTGLISIPIRVFNNMHQVVIIYQNSRYILGLLEFSVSLSQ